MTTPFVCVALAFVLIYIPRIFAAVAQGMRPEGFDNKHPRDQQARLEGWGKRAVGAHLNGFEAFAPFAAAVFICHLAHANAGWSTNLAVAFVAARALYIALYIGNVDKVRTAVWGVGFGSTFALFLLPYWG
jgi:uncharacterized MAPEG superfamily protein